jgi:predicted RNase H-like HicB family nuclease
MGLSISCSVPSSGSGCYSLEVTNEFTAIIEPAEEGGFWAYCPEVPGANGQGETVEETMENLADAIELMLDVLREEANKSASQSATRRTVRVG